MSPDLLPVLVLSLLLLFSGGEQSAQVIHGGEHRLATTEGAVVVTDGTVSVPADAVIGGSLHVVGGDVIIEGQADAGVTVLGGTLLVRDTAQVADGIGHYGGLVESEPGASAAVAGVELGAVRSNPLAEAAWTAGGALALAAAGALWARRSSRTLATVGRAMTQHPVVTTTVGALVGVTAISVLVFMAFTLVLLPVTILGLLAGLALVGYGTLALGHVVGRRLPMRGAGPATAVGVLAVLGAFRLLELVPVVGDLIVLGTLLAALGAVIVTYLGLRTFTPAVIRETGSHHRAGSPARP